ncbi:hypothetical protein EZS27_025280, partial [termite gut metagenome]
VKITERKTKKDWAAFIEEIAENYKDAKKITLVMDNYDTHKPGIGDFEVVGQNEGIVNQISIYINKEELSML